MEFKGPFKGPSETAYCIPESYGTPKETTSHRLEKLHVNLVPWGHYAVSDGPLASFDYCECRALIFKSNNIFGLAHIYGDHDDPSEYVDGMLRELCPNGKVSAVIVSRHNPIDIEKACRERGINLMDMGTTRYSEPRDVLVLPSLREVEIFTKDSVTVFSMETMSGSSPIKT